MKLGITGLALLGVAVAAGAVRPVCGQEFLNWETPHVSPVDITPDGARLLAVNTADNRLEIFDITDAGLVPVGAIPVGLDPVSVRARTNDEAWVVNHVSDSISIVDLPTMNTRLTIATGDEPTDVVFAGAPARAFVSVSQLNQVKVYDPLDPAAPPAVLDIAGEDPRALATDGQSVYVAIFESGNRTTILNEEAIVSQPGWNPYPGDPNPPPNSGEDFVPPINPDLDPPPPVSLVVRKSENGAWLDDNGGDWSAPVFWDLNDHDVAVIDAGDLSVRYVTGGMNLNMHLAVGPTGRIAVVGTDAINEIRFEPNINGIFVRVVMAAFDAGDDAPDAVLDLNPHLTYEEPTVEQSVRDLSIGDPRGVAWSASGERIYVAGMGSNNVVVTDATGQRVGRVEVGAGPTGLAIDADRGRVYVLNKFDGSISIIDEKTLAETTRVPFFDPTPDVIRLGRPHLYDTHATSGLGQASCASCHIDARMDQLAWDLGDPSGEMQPFDQTCIAGGDCVDWHPMKGPMSTQTLVGLTATEPFHWRGDRASLAAFNPAFVGLLGDDEMLSGEAMGQFQDFVTTLQFPPNPYRNLDNTLPTAHPSGGNAVTGEVLFSSSQGPMEMNGIGLNCIACHALPTGTNAQILAPLRNGGITQNSKTAQLRNLYDKAGFFASPSTPSNKGFGFIHDGSFDSLERFLNFFFAMTPEENVDLQAFLLSLSTDTPAGIGVQTTLAAEGDPHPEQLALIDAMVALAEIGDVGLVVKGRYEGLTRGFRHSTGEQFQSDRQAEVVTLDALVDAAGPGAELTFTLVPFGSARRIGIERDGDGFFDRDEIDAGTDPADPRSFPGGCPEDLDQSGDVGFDDLLAVLAAWGPCPNCPEDLDNDHVVEFDDLLAVLARWGACP